MLEDVRLSAFKTERESENIRKLSERKRLFMKSEAKSIAFASAVNTEEPSGIRKEMQWFPDITAHPTFRLWNHQCRYVHTLCNVTGELENFVS